MRNWRRKIKIIGEYDVNTKVFYSFLIFSSIENEKKKRIKRKGNYTGNLSNDTWIVHNFYRLW